MALHTLHRFPLTWSSILDATLIHQLELGLFADIFFDSRLIGVLIILLIVLLTLSLNRTESADAGRVKLSMEIFVCINKLLNLLIRRFLHEIVLHYCLTY